jgi:serine/threonine protein kinase
MGGKKGMNVLLSPLPPFFFINVQQLILDWLLVWIDETVIDWGQPNGNMQTADNLITRSHLFVFINRMAPEVIREDYYNEKIDLWSLGITIIEMMDRVPPHYLIKDEEELFDIIATEPSPTFTYSHPSMYMRGLVAWLLDEEASTRPTAKDVLMVSL